MDGKQLVRAAICSLDGGFNGLNIDRQLSIVGQEDGTIRYALIDVDGVAPDQVFTVTISAAG